MKDNYDVITIHLSEEKLKEFAYICEHVHHDTMENVILKFIDEVIEKYHDDLEVLQGKKDLTVVLSDDEKEKLRKISVKNKNNFSETVKRLIQEEYEQIFENDD